tara:strand:- start:557 stop:835 length:279 start_codon:yes stop_codon:yes gene_type:complete
MPAEGASLRAIGLLLLLSVIWASAFTLIRVTVVEIPTATMVAGRLAFAGLFLFVVLRWSGKSLPLDRENLVVFALLGVTGNVIQFTLIAVGE